MILWHLNNRLAGVAYILRVAFFNKVRNRWNMFCTFGVIWQLGTTTLTCQKQNITVFLNVMINVSSKIQNIDSSFAFSSLSYQIAFIDTANFYFSPQIKTWSLGSNIFVGLYLWVLDKIDYLLKIYNFKNIPSHIYISHLKS